MAILGSKKLGIHSVKKVNCGDLLEALIRIGLLATFLTLELVSPFVRKLQPEEVWMYRNPMTDSYVPGQQLWKMVGLVPLVTLVTFYLATKNRSDLRAGTLTASLAIPLNGVITNVIKLCVGRHRPDFLYRCWPDGNIPAGAFDTGYVTCSGDPDVVMEGRKSFPSGHSSFSFVTWGFVFFYVSGKLGTFQCRRDRGSWRLLVSVGLLLVPLVIAMSRAADYHHHWQDIVVGSVLGLATAWLVYRQHYPPLSSPLSHLPLSLLLEEQTDLQLVATNPSGHLVKMPQPI